MEDPIVACKLFEPVSDATTDEDWVGEETWHTTTKKKARTSFLARMANERGGRAPAVESASVDDSDDEGKDTAAEDDD